MITIDYKEYTNLEDKIDDYISSNLIYKDQAALERSFNKVVSGLIDESPIPHNVKGSLKRHILLDPDYSRAAKEIIIYNNTRKTSLAIRFSMAGRFLFFKEGVMLVDIIKKLKREWII